MITSRDEDQVAGLRYGAGDKPSSGYVTGYSASRKQARSREWQGARERKAASNTAGERTIYRIVMTTDAWAVKEEGVDEPIGTFETYDEAADFAIKTARVLGSLHQIVYYKKP